MGLHSRKHDHARYGNDTHRHYDQRKPAPRLCCGPSFATRLSSQVLHILQTSLVLVLTCAQLAADPIRVASYDTELSRRGPGLMLRDILRDDPQVAAITGIVAHIAPDILFLQSVDYDSQLHGARALRDRFAAQGVHFDHIFALTPNTGIQTGVDLNGDGKSHGPADAQGYGRFSGADSMVLLSRWPIATPLVQNFSALLWRDAPDAQLPQVLGALFPSAQALNIQRLSSVGHWVVPIDHPEKQLTLLLFAAGPPVFDGPEDRNGLRNADEIRLWTHLLDGKLGTPPTAPFVLMGNANLDPEKGEGRRRAIRDLLHDPRLQDPHSRLGPTVDWDEPKPGNLRVDYVLPSADLQIIAADVFWPRTAEQGQKLLSVDNIAASRHRMVWVDLDF